MVLVIKDNKNRKFYIKKKGNFVALSSTKAGALDDLPEGYKLKWNKFGRPYLKPEQN